MLVLALTSALADLPPPPGTKRVPYRVEVVGQKEDPVLVVFPWSDSDGAPTAELGVVGPKGLGFGRRIAGRPAFWLVPRKDLDTARSLEDEALRAWMTANAEPCEGQVNPRHQVPSGGPDAITDTFKLHTGPCRVVQQAVKDAPGRVGPEPSLGWGCRSSATPAGWGWLLIGLLASRRRVVQRSA